MVTHTFAQSFFNELLIGLLLKYEDFSKIWIEFPEILQWKKRKSEKSTPCAIEQKVPGTVQRIL
jgi:hypothetical protein